MTKFVSRGLWTIGFVGALALTNSITADAAMDNERWNQGQAELQKNLPPGQSADAYWKKLEDLGYKITSTNYNNPDYVEYEVVKGDQTWEVQIDVDDDTHKATKVDIAMNAWKTDATKQELERNGTTAGMTTSERRRTTVARNNQYSDRDRSTTDQMIRDLEALPVGHDKQYYKDALRQRGYDITKINTDDRDELKLEAVKNGHSLQMEVDFDEDSGRSTSVDASTLWAESESTTRARQAQEMGTSSRPHSSSGSSMSTPDRRSQVDPYSTR